MVFQNNNWSISLPSLKNFNRTAESVFVGKFNKNTQKGLCNVWASGIEKLQVILQIDALNEQPSRFKWGVAEAGDVESVVGSNQSESETCQNDPINHQYM